MVSYGYSMCGGDTKAATDNMWMSAWGYILIHFHRKTLRDYVARNAYAWHIYQPSQWLKTSLLIPQEC